jgi:cysteine synthase A
LSQEDIPDGIEACIGNTPLFRIRSLSEATGCEIFAKAEVNPNTLEIVHFSK